MSRVAYVDGAFADLRAARVRVEDRGFQFADGLYEVWSVEAGRLVDEEGHFARLERSLAALEIAAPMSRAALRIAIRETLRRNHVRDGIVYLQVTRGAAPRDHAFPRPGVPPTIVITARAQDRAALARRIREGVRVITAPDIRWGRCDIKSIALLPNVLAKEEARRAGASEAWLVAKDGYVTEGAASNAWIVTRAGAIATRELSANILRGVTREEALRVAQSLQLRIEERPFTVAEALEAREAFVTSASNPVVSVVAIDGRPIGDGAPGPVAARLREAYLAARRNAR